MGLNYIGVFLFVISLAPFKFMKEHKTETQELISTGQDEEAGEAAHTSGVMFVAGFIVALVAGVFMGSNFDPPTYLAQLGETYGHSPKPMDYVLSHFCGIILASSFYFLGYLAVNGTRNRQSYYGKHIVMPGIG